MWSFLKSLVFSEATLTVSTITSAYKPPGSRLGTELRWARGEQVRELTVHYDDGGYLFTIVSKETGERLKVAHLVGGIEASRIFEAFSSGKTFTHHSYFGGIFETIFSSSGQSLVVHSEHYFGKVLKLSLVVVSVVGTLLCVLQ